MRLLNEDATKTRLTYSLAADDGDLESYRKTVAKRLSSSVKVPGFRPNKAPAEMIFKYADQSSLQNEFLNLAVNDLYLKSQKELNYKIVGEPKIEVTKFVPYTTLEIKAEVPIVKEIKLPDYRNLKLKKQTVSVTKQQLDLTIKELATRSAKVTLVKRAAKIGDQVIIDFDGSDAKTKEELPSASAKDYTLILGDNTLVPGFEDQLVGLSAGKTKSFELTFPKDYSQKSFTGRKVRFKVGLIAVNEVELPKIDDAFAKTVGPFKSLDELKSELKRQLQAENDRRVTIDFENQILNLLAEKTVVELDDGLIESEFNALINDAKQTSASRGQTWKEYLASLSETSDSYDKKLREIAITRIKAGLAIGEIASKEGLNINNAELDEQIAKLRSQYASDDTMQAELDNPANRRELGTRLLTEKVLGFIQSHQAKKA